MIVLMTLKTKLDDWPLSNINIHGKNASLKHKEQFSKVDSMDMYVSFDHMKKSHYAAPLFAIFLSSPVVYHQIAVIRNFFCQAL